MKGRSAGFLSATGGILPLIFLVSGIQSARADEIADLRANQELLQRRIDQLAQVPVAPGSPYGGGPPNPAAGQPAGAGSFPRSFLIPGTDTSIRIGGQMTEVIDYWFTGGPVNSSPQSTTVGINGQLQSVPLDKSGHVILGVAQTPDVQHSRSNGVFHQSPRESRLSVETRTPTAYGEARTYMEFDWAGSTQFYPGGNNPTSVSDNLGPRLRFAYGTLGGFLAGQANSNFSDPDANAEALDFGGNPGDPGVVRVPQIRYTMPLAPWGWPGAVSVSAETPETDILTPAGIVATDTPSSSLPSGPGLAGTLGGVCTGVTVVGTACSGTALTFNPTKSIAPDLTGAWYIPQPWGHMDFSVVVRPGLEINDGRFISRQFVGYGGHIGGDVKPGWFGWAKDDITFHIVAGDGIGRYLNSSTNFSLVTNYLGNGLTSGTTLASANNVIVKSTREVGGGIGYQHWWLPNLRQNVSFGWNHHDADTRLMGTAQQGAANKELTLVRTNLIWSPVSFVDMGIEYLWGHRVVYNNLKGDEHVLISKFQFRF